MAMESVNDILSLLTISLFVLIPLYYLGQRAYLWLEKMSNKRYERLMKEDDWHM